MYFGRRSSSTSTYSHLEAGGESQVWTISFRENVQQGSRESTSFEVSFQSKLFLCTDNELTFDFTLPLLLSIQYRMHPEISIFPSKTFYESKLQDGPNMAKLTAQPWHSDFLLKPFKLFSTSGLESAGRGHSKINREEAEVALAIYQRLLRDYSTYDFDRKIGIVSAYKEQVFEMKRVFRSRYGEGIFESVDFNTVDGFQGQEKSISEFASFVLHSWIHEFCLTMSALTFFYSPLQSSSLV